MAPVIFCNDSTYVAYEITYPLVWRERPMSTLIEYHPQVRTFKEVYSYLVTNDPYAGEYEALEPPAGMRLVVVSSL